MPHSLPKLLLFFGVLLLLNGCASPRPYHNVHQQDGIRVITSRNTDQFEHQSHILSTSPQYRLVYTLLNQSPHRRALQARVLFKNHKGDILETSEPEMLFFFPHRPVTFEVAALSDPELIASHEFEIMEPARLRKPHKPDAFPQ